MKRLVILTGMIIVGLMVMNVYAQQAQTLPYGGMYGGMYGGGMMGQGMMYGQNGYYAMGPGMMYGYGLQLGNAALFLQNRDYLNLTNSQVNQLREIQNEELQETSQTRTNLQIAQLELNDQLIQDNPTMSNIEDIVRDVESLSADLLTADIKYTLDARKVLTPVQIALFADLTGRGNGANTSLPNTGGMDNMPNR